MTESRIAIFLFFFILLYYYYIPYFLQPLFIIIYIYIYIIDRWRVKEVMQEDGTISADFRFTTGQKVSVISCFIFHKTSNLTIILLLEISDISNKQVNWTKDFFFKSVCLKWNRWQLLCLVCMQHIKISSHFFCSLNKYNILTHTQ